MFFNLQFLLNWLDSIKNTENFRRNRALKKPHQNEYLEIVKEINSKHLTIF